MNNYKINPFSTETTEVLDVYSQAFVNMDVTDVRKLSEAQRNKTIEELMRKGYGWLGGFTGNIEDAQSEITGILRRADIDKVGAIVGPCAVSRYGVWVPSERTMDVSAEQ